VRGVSGDTGTGLELPAQQSRAAVRAANKAPTKNGTASEFTVADPHFTPFVADDDPAPASPRLYCLLLLVLYPSTVPPFQTEAKRYCCCRFQFQATNPKERSLLLLLTRRKPPIFRRPRRLPASLYYLSETCRSRSSRKNYRDPALPFARVDRPWG
jgi:hypothetical protein